ncbi:hypothetical protein TIFTF001_050820 [Ficus carica]|uniref:Uncharacterized protein n=1 Tax=Ficus carica TaxID=3494 RepID=A0AA87YN67_FICCA|nr:hypothetical protein TIFTF001_050820 [Ficus carica]
MAQVRGRPRGGGGWARLVDRWRLGWSVACCARCWLVPWVGLGWSAMAALAGWLAFGGWLDCGLDWCRGLDCGNGSAGWLAGWPGQRLAALGEGWAGQLQWQLCCLVNGAVEENKKKMGGVM